MAWTFLALAGVFEVLFATFLKLSEGFSKPLYTILFIIVAALSFYFLTKAMDEIPVGIAYAVWTGVGIAGVSILGVVIFSEPVSVEKLFFISTLLFSIVGLKLVSN